MSSSRGDELSYERVELANGVFTESLLRALTDPAIDADGDGRVEAHQLRDAIVEAVAGMTSGLQHPTIDWDNPERPIYLEIAAEAAGLADE